MEINELKVRAIHDFILRAQPFEKEVNEILGSLVSALTDSSRALEDDIVNNLDFLIGTASTPQNLNIMKEFLEEMCFGEEEAK